MKLRRILIAAAVICAATWISCSRSQEPASSQPAADAASAPVAAPAEVPAPTAAPAPAGRKKSAQAPATAPRQAAAQPAAAPRARTLTLPEGTEIRVRTTTALSTKTAETGAKFTASLAEPLISGDTVIAPKGALVEGQVVESDSGGRVKGRASIAVRLASLQLEGGREVELPTDTIGREAESTKKKDAAKVGIGAGVGAAIGAIAGGGRGAAIGAAAGAGAGTGAVLATRGDAAVIPAETVLTFKLRAPVTVTK